MRQVRTVAALIAALSLVPAISGAQTPNVIKDVRTAIQCTAWPCSPVQDFSAGEAILEEYRAAHGTTSQALEAMSWLGRAAFAAGRYEKASEYASETYDLAVEASKSRSIAEDANLEIALGAAIEVQAQARAARGQRSEAVYFLKRELENYGGTPLHKRIQKNINLLSLEGQPAPALQAADALGRPVPGFDDLKGKVVVLFFWAHWCPDCKAQGPALSTLLDRYRQDGLTVVAPTQLYGYTVRRKAAGPEEELKYIEQTREATYPFLRDAAVPVNEANHQLYGVSTTPTMVIVDRGGIVRTYHPGGMTLEELEAVVKPLLAAGRTN
jgi:peroxiredoxin